MSVLVFGKTGQVGRELALLAPTFRYIDRTECDLSDPSACAALIRSNRPNLIINAAAYTAVDKAEEEVDLALQVNAYAPGAMAEAAAEIGAAFVHISTDCVFNGSGTRPWAPTDSVNPINHYGASKAEGERRVIAAGGTFAILRTSWVFSQFGSNFVQIMLRLSQTRDALSIVSDQIGGPTSASSIAAACMSVGDALISDPEKSGVYHFCGAPDVSRVDFAAAVFELAGQSVAITSIPTRDYPTVAERPLNSRLDCSSMSDAFNIAQPDWRIDLAKVIAQIEERHDT